jgi:hypothetical protein
MWVKWKLVLVSFEIVLIFTQDRCTVCVERVIGFVSVSLEIVLIPTQDRCLHLPQTFNRLRNHFGCTR